jgi:hypothetical protein
MIDDDVLRMIKELAKKVDTLHETLKNNPSYQTKWMTKKEVLSNGDCSERTLQSLRDSGKLHFTNPFGGSKYFYLRKEVMALFDDNFNGDKK